jgi:hypothetical protein
MNHHPLVVELLARERIEDFRREAQIARQSRVTSKSRSRRSILRRKASPAC